MCLCPKMSLSPVSLRDEECAVNRISNCVIPEPLKGNGVDFTEKSKLLSDSAINQQMKKLEIGLVINDSVLPHCYAIPPLLQADKIKKNDIKLNRKCSYCRIVCQNPPFLVCGGCKKRAYCSGDCQEADWSITGTGQRHVNWCTTYEFGEEDVDWEVVPIPHKGFGIISKIFMPVGYKIMVDPVYTDPNDHPGIQELAPIGASLEEKFEINAVQGDEHRDGGKSYIGLCFSRANHNCQPNADYVYDETARVVILFAQQDILPGDEICISYTSFADFALDRETANLQTPEEEFISVHHSLASNWGIFCPKDCFCQDTNARKLVIEGRRIHKEMSLLVGRGQTEEALKYGEKFLDIQRHLNVSWLKRVETEYHCFQIALMRQETLCRAKKYINNVFEFYKANCPYSQFTKTCQNLLDHPEADRNYLIMSPSRQSPQ